jgi:hypothetical protein
VCAVKINVALVRCGQCGKKYSNPLSHVCVTRMDRRPSSRKTKVKPKLTVRCGGCGSPLGNPLTHRCVTKTDFKRRKAKSAKPEPPPKPAATGSGHEYTACDDDDCSRFQCRVYKQGVADGIASCPLPHQG